MEFGSHLASLAVLAPAGRPDAPTVDGQGASLILSEFLPSFGKLTVGPIGRRTGVCGERQLAFCQGVLPYGEARLPNWVGDTTAQERNLSVPYFEIIAESECNARVQQYACAVLEPPCRQTADGQPLPPCRQFCRGDCALSLSVSVCRPVTSTIDCVQPWPRTARATSSRHCRWPTCSTATSSPTRTIRPSASTWPSPATRASV